MRIRNILLVHPTRSMRALIKKFVFAELSDVEFIEAQTGETALAELDMQAFDIIVTAATLSDMAADHLKNKAVETNHNATTPIIALSEEENSEARDKLVQQGFEHVVQIRVRPSDLIQKINYVCNPRQWRKDKRFHIPRAKVILYSAEHHAEGVLINLSRGGLLMELVTYDPIILMLADIQLTLRIPGPSNYVDIDGLTCRLSRVSVTEWHPNSSPAVLRATFIFQDPTEQQQEQLESVLQLAVENKLEDDGEDPDEAF